MKKKLISFVLSLALAASLSAGMTAGAVGYEPQFTEAADILYELGLFKGTGTNADGTPIYALDRQATRIEGLVMLIRLLGEEDEALAFTGTCPFTDVPAWAEKYAGYAYAKGYTKGTSATTFSDGPLYGNAFLTFVLRALGYSDSKGDFAYNTAILKGEELGLIARGECANQSVAIYRDSCAQIAFNALVTPKKGTESFLIDYLVKDGVVSKETLEKSNLNNTGNFYGRTNLDYKAWHSIYTAAMTAKVREAAAEDAKYYGLPEDITWVGDPRTEEEFINNMYCCFLIGDYSLYSLVVQDQDAVQRFCDYLRSPKFHELTACNPELMGAYCNGDISYGYYGLYDDETGYFCANMDLSVEDGSLSNETIFEQQEKAKEAAYKLSETMHRNGKIKDGMTQKEIAQVYYDYFRSLRVRPSNLPYDFSSRGQYMKYDTVYACLVNKVADCMGRCAAFNVMMHIEGISAQSLSCHPVGAEEGNNHVLNRVVLDGVEYVCDWGNNLPIQSLESAQTRYEFFPESLELARSRG